MANTDAPHGFRILHRLGGGSLHLRRYKLASGNAVIGRGDLLVMTSAGVVDRAAAGATQSIGVAVEPKSASSSDEYILVCDDPDVVLEAQTDDGTGTLTSATGINLNADIVVNDAINGISRMEIDESSGATTSTLPLKVIGLFDAEDNEAGEFNRLVCVINNHVLKSVGVAGV